MFSYTCLVLKYGNRKHMMVPLFRTHINVTNRHTYFLISTLKNYTTYVVKCVSFSSSSCYCEAFERFGNHLVVFHTSRPSCGYTKVLLSCFVELHIHIGVVWKSFWIVFFGLRVNECYAFWEGYGTMWNMMGDYVFYFKRVTLFLKNVCIRFLLRKYGS